MPEIIRYYNKLESYIHPNKVLLIYGPRQVGKTTLLQHYLQHTSLKYKLDSGDNVMLRELLQQADFNTLREYAHGYDLIAIDEAQKIPNIGEIFKIMVDQIPGIHIIATGSSSFELAGQVGEPLTGRKITITLYPISQIELRQYHNIAELKEKLPLYLRYGSYPEIITCNNEEDKRDKITELTQSYLLRDILALDRVKSPKILLDLLRLLAFQIGSEVSYSELAQKLVIDAKTVARYLDLLEKSFVLYNLRGFSRNLRKEITKKSKYYFYDLGVRNTLIANFNSLSLRNDIGQLWENFLVIERVKKQQYHRIIANNYFWRKWDKQEIDWLEERGGILYGYEFKWSDSKKAHAPKEWLETYDHTQFEVIHQGNYAAFVIGDNNTTAHFEVY